ncbi:MATE family efflux transporter [Flexithrix dorotheae]|uniref:MATE family efflux transporter n=1 Tax=Flexithrix dorotheae TaxID=70993 RepID=UPI00035EB29A|nr:MATE family efflux transporter [Flexithrix dorotheae]
MESSKSLGTEKIGKLILKQAIPASIGFLILSIYSIVDTIYVGRYVGSLAIAAITVVMPISFLISSIGIAIGVGGASIISRALGKKDIEKAKLTFGNQISLTLFSSISFVILGFILEEPILLLFGGKGGILEHAQVYFRIILYGVPFLAWAMMANNVIRSVGKPKVAMFTLIVPAIINIILDPIFIFGFDLGLAGAAWATTISYVCSAGYTLWFFISSKSEMKITRKGLSLNKELVKEIFSIGFISMARQGSISLLTVVLNHSLFAYGGELGVAVYGIINRLMMLLMFPIIGLTQGFMPIAGFNYGAGAVDRVKQTIKTSIKYGFLVSSILLALLILFSESIVEIFTQDEYLLQETPKALILVFLASPIVPLQMIGAAYFQAIGKAFPALLLTLTKQGFFLVPLVLILPPFYDTNGIWYSFPIADFLAAIVTVLYLDREIRKNLISNPDKIPRPEIPNEKDLS